VARDRSKAGKYLVNASLLGTGFSIIMIFVMCMVANLITDNTDIIWSVYVLSISLVPYSVATVCESICRAFEKIEYITISNVVSNGLKVLVGLVLLYKGCGVVILMATVLGSYFLYFCLSLYFAFACIGKKHWEVDFGFCKWIIGTISAFALIYILSTVRWNIDMLILTKMMGEADVGFYSAASRLMNIGKLGLSCYIVAIQPVIFMLYKSSREKFSMVCEESMRYLLILLIPIAFGTTLLSEKLILVVFRSEFLPAAHVLSIIIWILIISGENLIFANALVASDKQKINLMGNFIGMFSNICLNLLLIPKLGLIGAGAASLLSSIILFGFQYYYVSKYLFRVRYYHHSKKPIIASVFMGIGILFFREMNLFFVIGLAIIIYFLGLLALKTFVQRDRDLVRRLLVGERG
jgi:O-antigen/teichoic acid export membrane protein